MITVIRVTIFRNDGEHISFTIEEPIPFTSAKEARNFYKNKFGVKRVLINLRGGNR